MATVTVRGELDVFTRSQLRERLAWVMETGPQWLVLDLREVTDHVGGQITAVVAAVRRQLPPGCFLEVRPAAPVLQTGPQGGWHEPQGRCPECGTGGHRRLAWPTPR